MLQTLRRAGVKSRSSVESVNFPPCSLDCRPPGVLFCSSRWFVSSLEDAAFWLDEQRLQNRTVTTRHALSRYPLGHSNRLKRRRVSSSPPSVTHTQREREHSVHLSRPSLSRPSVVAAGWNSPLVDDVTHHDDDDDDDAPWSTYVKVHFLQIHI